MVRKDEIIVKDVVIKTMSRDGTDYMSSLAYGKQGMPQAERLRKLNTIAIQQMSVLEESISSTIAKIIL